MTATSPAAGLSALRMRPLATSLAATIAIVAPGHGVAQFAGIDLTTTTVVVQNCNDSGPGSLRAAYANAVDNETIDLSQLLCSRITLGSALTDPVAAANVTLTGPGKERLVIDGDDLYRVLVHRGNGSLHVDHLTIMHGHYDGARGGCIYSAGSVEASGSSFSSCVLSTTEPMAYGGAIFAKATVNLTDSVVADSSADGPQPANSLGGGIYSVGIVLSRSTISGNTAGLGGGMFAAGLVQIEDSTLSGNHARYYGGALYETVQTGFSNVIENTTISGNDAYASGGAIYTSTFVNIYNCTIVRNKAHIRPEAAGLRVHDVSILQSSIVANNTSADGLIEGDIDAFGAGSISGSNNLIMASIVPVPAGTITVDPRLGPLQDNGGATWTHALLPGSPAIGRGNNVLSLHYDQRGAPFGRVDGSSADIGAFEFRDTVFRADLEPPE